MALRLRRGTALERLTIVPAAGELIYTTDTKKLYIGDGAITGGNEVNTEIKGLLADDLYLSIYKLLGSGLELDGSTGNISANLITGDLIGSVYADDSTKIIDGLTGKVVGPIRISVNDIEILGGNAGQVLATDGAGNLTWSAGGSGGASALNDLSDVTLGSLTTNEVLKWSGTQWINAPVTPSGHFYGDISGSVFADDSTKIIDGITGKITTGSISLMDDTISSSTVGPLNFVAERLIFASNESYVQAPVTFNVLASSTTAGGIISGLDGAKRIEINGVRGSIDSPVHAEPGDILGAYSIGHRHPGSDTMFLSAIMVQVDYNKTVASNSVPQKLIALVNDGVDGATSKIFSFDSYGRFAINQENAQATCDINGVMRLAPQASEPNPKVEGMIAVANRTSWDPASKGSGGSYPVYYDGSTWNAFY